jgi:F-type H+-transporting ATPase subunit gamma
MANLRDIKNRIESVKSTRQITRTMEMVSTAKIKKAQERIESARPYALAMMEVLGNVARFVQDGSHPLLEVHDKREKGAEVDLIVVGKKGIGYFRYRGIEPLATYRDIGDSASFAHARDIASHVIGAYEREELDAVYVVFNHFRSVADQKPETHRLLPIERTVMEESEDGLEITPEYMFEPSPEAVLERLLPTYV